RAQAAQGLLFHVWQDVVHPAARLAAPRAAVGVADPAPAPTSARESLVGVVVAVTGQADLLEVVQALVAVGRLADLLHRRDEQANEDGDNGDHHQQLDQREAGSASLSGKGSAGGRGSVTGHLVTSGNPDR